MKRLSVRIDDNTHSKLIELANQEGVSLAESVRDLIENQINDKTPTQQPDKATEKLFKQKSLEEQLIKLTKNI